MILGGGEKSELEWEIGVAKREGIGRDDCDIGMAARYGSGI